MTEARAYQYPADRDFAITIPFTDRDEKQQEIMDALDPPPGPDEHRVLMYYGVGGEGKSKLALHMQERIEKEKSDCPVVRIDFKPADHRQAAEGLLEIRNQLHQQGVRMPIFDFAYLRWWRLKHKGQDPAFHIPEFIRDMQAILPDFAEAFGNAAAEMPLFGAALKLARLGKAWLTERSRAWLEREYQELDRLGPDDLFKRLPRLLARSIDSWRHDRPPRMPPVAIIFDAMDELTADKPIQTGLGTAEATAWIRSLIEAAPGILFVLFGRDALQWQKLDPWWENIITPERLGGLSPDDAQKLILASGVTEQDIASTMIEGARDTKSDGVLPFYLELQLDLYARKRRSGETITAENFGDTHWEITDRFLTHLGASKRCIEHLALSRRTNRQLYNALRQSYAVGNGQWFRWHELSQFSFAHVDEHDNLRFHRLIHEHMLHYWQSEQPDHLQEVRRFFADWWVAQCTPAEGKNYTPAHEDALEEARHAMAQAHDAETFGGWAYQTGLAMHLAGRYSPLYRHWPETDAWLDALELPATHRLRGCILDMRGGLSEMLGDLESAADFYQSGLLIAEKVAQKDPENAEWQRDLSISHNKIGDVRVKQGRLTGAVVSFEKALVIRQELAEKNSDNTQWQRDLSVSHEKIGDVQIEQDDLSNALVSFQSSLDIRKTLTRKAPGNTLWQRDLFVSHNKIGDVQVQQGDPTKARESFEAGLEIAEKLAEKDPENAEWQRDLSISHNNIGDVQLAQGELTNARESFEAGLEIAEKLTQKDPDNALWQLDLSVPNVRLAAVAQAAGQNDEAIARYRKAYRIATNMRDRNILNPVDHSRLPNLVERLAKLGAAP